MTDVGRFAADGRIAYDAEGAARDRAATYLQQADLEVDTGSSELFVRADYDDGQHPRTTILVMPVDDTLAVDSAPLRNDPNVFDLDADGDVTTYTHWRGRDRYDVAVVEQDKADLAIDAVQAFFDDDGDTAGPDRSTAPIKHCGPGSGMEQYQD
ncbi:MAG: hypothetical protein SVU88_00905 [Candidatus Nanohaloarchaea archaeon]|nr:hypothetical protein [Candidatus Nanohaloarchaea archaeon]